MARVRIRSLEENGDLLGEIVLAERPRLATVFRQVGFDVIFDAQAAAVGVTREDKAQDRQDIVVSGVVRVCRQGVRRTPEAPFNGFDVFKLCQFLHRRCLIKDLTESSEQFHDTPKSICSTRDFRLESPALCTVIILSRTRAPFDAALQPFRDISMSRVVGLMN